MHSTPAQLVSCVFPSSSVQSAEGNLCLPTSCSPTLVDAILTTCHLKSSAYVSMRVCVCLCIRSCVYMSMCCCVQVSAVCSYQVLTQSTVPLPPACSGHMYDGSKPLTMAVLLLAVGQ